MAWYNASWTYRIAITVDNTKVDADLTDFPVYVSLADLSSDFHTNVKSDGGDIRVTKSDGTTEVPIDLVFYDAGTDTGELHFKADGTLSSSVDTVFYIYYGNSGASLLSASATYGANNVWTNDYVAVYHMQEGTNLTDARGTYTATKQGNPATATGKLSGNSIDFDGTGDYYTMSDNAEWTIGASGFTHEGWVYPDALPSASVAQRQFLWGKGNASNYEWGMSINSYNQMFGKYVAQWYALDGGTATEQPTSADAATGAWVYLASVKATNATTENVDNYLNGAADNGTSANNLSSLGNGTAAPYLGARTDLAENEWNGKLDEVRFSKTARTSTWISTQYNNQNSPSTFYTDGAQQTDTATIPNKIYKQSQAIKRASFY